MANVEEDVEQYVSNLVGPETWNQMTNERRNIILEPWDGLL